MIAIATVVVPYPGLRPFEPADQEIFCGQDENIAALYQRLGDSRFVAVLGESGAGKSSLVSAGLIPRLKNIEKNGLYRWHILRFNPEMCPLEKLANATAAGLATDSSSSMPPSGFELEENMKVLRTGPDGLSTLLLQHQEGQRPAATQLEPVSDGPPSGPSRAAGPQPFYLILVDQFEELFRFRRESSRPLRDDESALFVKLLLDAAQNPKLNAYVVLTMRSEYIGECAEFHGLSHAVNDGLFLLPRMTRLQCEEAISDPLDIEQAEHITIAPALTQQLLNETEEHEDGLPLLQHALRWLYDDRKSGATSLTLPEDYLKTPEQSARQDGTLRPGATASTLPQDHGERPGSAVMQSTPPPSAAAPKIDSRFVAWCLNEHLDKLYDNLPSDAHRTAAKRIFRLLAERDSKGRLVRRACPWEEILKVEDPKVVRQAVDTFRNAASAQCFVRPYLQEREKLEPDDTVDISHEVLLRRWVKYGEWIKEETNSRRSFLRLAELADEYYQGPADALKVSGKGDLLRGTRLEDLLQWQKEQQPTPAWAKRYLGEEDAALGRRRYELKPALEYLSQSERRGFLERLFRWLIIANFAIVALAAAALFVQARRNQYQLQLQDKQLEIQKAKTIASIAQGDLAEFERTKANEDLILANEHLKQITALNGELGIAYDRENKDRKKAEDLEKQAIAVGTQLSTANKELEMRRQQAVVDKDKAEEAKNKIKASNDAMNEIINALQQSDERQKDAGGPISRPYVLISEHRKELAKEGLVSLEKASAAGTTFDPSVNRLLDYAAPVLVQRAANTLELELLTDHRLSSGDARYGDSALLTGEAARATPPASNPSAVPPSPTERLIGLAKATGFYGLVAAAVERSSNPAGTGSPRALGYMSSIVSVRWEGQGRTAFGRFFARLVGRDTLPLQGASAISQDGSQLAISEETGRVLIAAPSIVWRPDLTPSRASIFAKPATSAGVGVKTAPAPAALKTTYNEQLRFSKTRVFKTALRNPDLLTYSRNGHFLLMAAPGKWELWNVEQGKKAANAKIPKDSTHQNGQDRSIQHAVVSDDGKYVIAEVGYKETSGFSDTELDQWTIRDDKSKPEEINLQRFGERLLGGTGSLLLLSVQRCLYTLPVGARVRASLSQCLSTPIRFADVDPESGLIAFADAEKLVVVRPGDNEKPLLEIQLLNVFPDGITGLHFAANGQQLITSFGSDIRLWDIRGLMDSDSRSAKLAALLVKLRAWKPDDKNQQKTSESLAKLVEELKEFVPAN